MAEVAPAPAQKPVTRRGRRVKTDILITAPELQEAILASPLKRLGGMAIDLAVIVLLSALAKPILGVFTGLTFASLGSRRVSGAKFWLAFRWVLIVLGAVVMILSATFVAGTPLVRTGVFNIAASEKSAAPPDAPILPPNPTGSDLYRAVKTYEERDAFLTAENKSLRERAGGRSLTTAAADIGKTLGLTFGWAGVYFTLLTAWFRGRTLGKLLMGTRVVRLDNRALTPMDAFIRNGGYAAGLATGMIGFLRLLWDSNRQAIHDRMASTVVVLGNSLLHNDTPVSGSAPSIPPEDVPDSDPQSNDSPRDPS